jgi:hypothetical protein
MKRKLLYGLVLLMFLAACGSQNSSDTPLNLDIQLRIEPSVPSVGDSILFITLRDEQGQAITNAELSVIGNMSHEGMSAVEASTTENENGVYALPFAWTMGGDWLLDVTVTLAGNGGTAQKRFDVFVNASSQESIIHQTPSPQGN